VATASGKPGETVKVVQHRLLRCPCCNSKRLRNKGKYGTVRYYRCEPCGERFKVVVK